MPGVLLNQVIVLHKSLQMQVGSEEVYSSLRGENMTTTVCVAATLWLNVSSCAA